MNHNGDKTSNEWEYILGDFLEMGAALTEDERICLMEELRRHPIQADAIDVHATFSIDGKLIVVVEGRGAAECWLYYPKERRIQKHPLQKPKSK